MSEAFSNEPIPVDHLPRFDDTAFVPVDPRYLRGRLAGLAAAAVVVAVVGTLVTVQVERSVLAAAVTAAVLVPLGLTAALSVAEVRRLGYQIREHDLSLRSGVITHRVETLPFARVQHVNVSRGPVERALGLSTLDVSSAGPDISIPGLAEDEASRIKALVTERAGAMEADAADGET